MASIPAAGRHFSILASCVVAATLLASLTTNACSSDSPAAAPDASDEPAPLLCDSFNGSGMPCSPVSDQKCFAMCATGGCKCVAGNGGGVWECTTDESCYTPGNDLDGGSDDGSLINIADGTVFDAPDDSASDAASDAPTDASDAGD